MILPSRSETNTGSGAFAMMMSATRAPAAGVPSAVAVAPFPSARGAGFTDFLGIGPPCVLPGRSPLIHSGVLHPSRQIGFRDPGRLMAAANALAQVAALVSETAISASGRENFGPHEQGSHQGGSERQVGDGEVRSRERLHGHGIGRTRA